MPDLHMKAGVGLLRDQVSRGPFPDTCNATKSVTLRGYVQMDISPIN
jgi:hypothetical protein